MRTKRGRLTRDGNRERLFDLSVCGTGTCRLLSRLAAVPFRCPAQVFLLCGIFPLVPGAGIFWFTYYLTDSQFDLSMQSGWMASKVAIAIVLGIILAMELPQRLFSHNHRTH